MYCLTEWRRVLKPGGLLMVAVPDLAAIMLLILEKSLPDNLRDLLDSVLFGGHRDEYDIHLVYDMSVCLYIYSRYRWYHSV